MKKLVLLIGPTCSGKSTLEKELNKRGVPSVVSYTTRAPRTGEINGRDYYFLEREAVSQLDAAGQIVQRVEFSGNLYGSTLESINKAFSTSDIAVIVVEPTGLGQFLEYASETGRFEVVSVYVNGPLSRLVARLVDRYDSDDNADDGYYWRRLVQQYEAFHEWPHYTKNWSIVLNEVDDDIPGKTVRDAADHVLDTIIKMDTIVR